MNQQTRSFRPFNVSTKVVKGAPVPKGPSPDALKGGSLSIVEFPSTKGHNVNSSLERSSRGRKPYKAHNNPLGRDGVTYEVVKGSLVPFNGKVN